MVKPWAFHGFFSYVGKSRIIKTLINKLHGVYTSEEGLEKFFEAEKLLYIATRNNVK